MNATDATAPAAIDARGLPCPQPVLLLRQALKTLATGERVFLLATDPMASVDVRAFCARTGHRFVSEREHGDHTEFSVERA